MVGFATCGPNKVIVVSGTLSGKPKIIIGGRIFVFPFQKKQTLSLNTMTLSILSQNVYTKQGVAITVLGIAQVKIVSSDYDILITACTHFIGKSTVEIENIAKETLEGHQRSIIGNMSVEEIYQDRKKFANAVFDVASTDLINMGMSIVSYTLTDIRDENGYLQALGKSRTAQVQRDAIIGEADAKCNVNIKKAQASLAESKEYFSNQIEIAKQKSNFEIENSKYNKIVETKEAISKLSYDLQMAKTKQELIAEQMNIKIVEKKQDIQIAKQEIFRNENELNSTIKQPALAQMYKKKLMAETEKNMMIKKAEAEADSIRMRAVAEAETIKAQSISESENMTRRAKAWEVYKKEARVDLLLKVLPEIVENITKNLNETDKIIMISNGDDKIGIEKITNEVMTVVEALPKMVERMSGIEFI